MNTPKTIFYKIYSPDGTLLDESWTDASFDRFTKKINGGFGECVINLARQFDDFGEGDDVRLNNRVDIYVWDKDITNAVVNANSWEDGRKIYSGYISGYRPWIKEDGTQGVSVILLGHNTKLSKDVLKTNTQTKLYSKATVGLTITSGDLAAADGGHIMRAIMDRYIAESVNNVIGYNGGSVLATSSNIKFTFDSETYLAAIERVREMSPAGWYWYLDSDNMFHFKAKPTTSTHVLYFQKHFVQINAYKNMENIINTVLLDDGLEVTNYRGYKIASSQGEYGRRLLQKSERYYGDTTTMDAEGNNILDTMNDPDIEIRLMLMDNNSSEQDNGYDIESIEVGDTVKIEGFEKSVVFEEGMIIKEFTYLKDRMEIVVQPVKIGMFDRMLTIKRQQSIALSEGRGETFTEV